MRRRHFILGLVCMTLAGALWAADESWTPPPRLKRPDLASDEGGLWAQMERAEAKLKTSPFLIRDPALNDYVHGVACKLAAEHCPDIRVYVVRTPWFNASMAPNGMMQVWSGLLIRMANEAQLAAVLGHEIGHYLARHSLERLQTAQSTSAVAQFLGLGLTMGTGSVASGVLTQVAAVAGFMSYSRDQEREADRIGLELMARAGYATAEASRVWRGLMEEAKGDEGSKEGDVAKSNPLFASHPAQEERLQTLAELARQRPGGESVGADAYRERLASERAPFLADELRRRRYGESMVLFDRLLQSYPSDARIHFLKGEAYRLRGKPGDLKRSLASYGAAVAGDDVPAELYRSLGMAQRRLGQEVESEKAFARYLELKPDAEDAELIRSYVRSAK
jgi:predicted Zn-dependent protease